MVKKSNDLEDPAERASFTDTHDRYYTLLAGAYDAAVRRLPVWKTWLKQALPHLQGPRVLEVSFGTGYLLTQYADRFEVYGVDYNRRMVEVATTNLARVGLDAALAVGNVEALPYRDGTFDTVLNTMAFTGYPNGGAALAEMRRVLRPGGRLVLVDFTHPADGNWLGMRIADLWKLSGDIIRDMHPLLASFDFDYTDTAVGAWGSVRLYVARIAGAPRGSP